MRNRHLLNSRRPSRVRPKSMKFAVVWRLALAAVAIALTATSSSYADAEILVVVSKNHPDSSLGVSELRPLFKVTKTNWSFGEKASPINLPPANDSRRTFDRVVLGMSPDEVSKYWIDRKIRGNGRPPRSLPSAPAVVAVVAANKGAVGYVPAGSNTDRVKVVARIRGGKLVPP
jgi:ABC-type phosphate transport system substrate-binding protein